MYLDRLRELFSGVEWGPFEEVVNGLYTLEGKGRRPKPPIAYFRAVLVKMLFEINSLRARSFLIGAHNGPMRKSSNKS